MSALDFDEALQMLGITVSVGPDGARRAYLRLIKTHKPETDPAGFMRVREAYERVRGEIAWRQTLEQPVASTDEGTSPSRIVEDQDADPTLKTGEMALDVPARRMTRSQGIMGRMTRSQGMTRAERRWQSRGGASCERPWIGASRVFSQNSRRRLPSYLPRTRYWRGCDQTNHGCARR